MIENLTNTEIAEKLALLLGMERKTENITSRMPGMSGYAGHNPSETTTVEYWKKGNIVYRNWSPATRWDHIGIVIEWMDLEKDMRLHSTGELLSFGDDYEHAPHVWGNLKIGELTFTPRHIALAALAALE